MTFLPGAGGGAKLRSTVPHQRPERYAGCTRSITDLQEILGNNFQG